jgi:hypothetical protein
MKKIVLLNSLICFCFLKMQAQTLDYSTDRPRHSISVNTVSKKYLQLETGLSMSTDKLSSSIKDVLFEHPSFLLRYGLLKGFELRLISDIITIKQEAINGDYIRTGMRNVQLGAKANVLKQKAALPAISLMAYYRINDLPFTRLRYDSINGGGFRVAFQNKLNDKWRIDYNVGVDWLSFRENGERYNYSLSPVFIISEKWNTYVETSGFIWSDVPPIHFLKLGLCYQFNQNSSVNIFGGKSWNTNSARKSEVYPRSHIAVLFSFKLKTSQNTQ